MTLSKKILEIVKNNKNCSSNLDFIPYRPSQIEFSNSNLYLCVVEYKKNIGFFLKEEDILDLAELFISQISRKSRDLDDSYRMDLLASQFMLWLSLTYKDEMIKCIPHPVTKKC
jgi:hypothetical protein